MEFLIITGLSGAGKSRASDVCEDLDYFCVDNFPPAMLPMFASLCAATKGRYEKVALVMDVRSAEEYKELDEALRSLDDLPCGWHMLFLEASPAAIIRRYKESRRPHPMAVAGGTLEQAVKREREFLAPLRARADYIIDTGSMSLNRLRAKMLPFLQPGKNAFSVNIVSFGYRNGIPPEADIVLDVRCLPNPFYEPELRELRGLDSAVSDYVFHTESSRQLLEKYIDLLLFSVPLYREDRTELTVAVGCTGGHHRSVAVAQALGDALEKAGMNPSVTHRDMEN